MFHVGRVSANCEEAVQNLLDSTYLLCYNREKMQMRHPFYVDIQYALKDFWTS
jgi:hypothetical protein